MTFQEFHEMPVPKSKAKLEHLTELPPEVAAWGRPYTERDRDLAYIQKYYAKLEKTYPAEWIAVFDGTVVAHAGRSAELWRQLKRLKLVEKSPVTFFIQTPVLDD